KRYVCDDVHVNSTECVWVLVKTGIRGIYPKVSPKYLQTDVNEYGFRYNRRGPRAPYVPPSARSRSEAKLTGTRKDTSIPDFCTSSNHIANVLRAVVTAEDSLPHTPHRRFFPGFKSAAR